jgi:hypothetical protein
MVFKAINGFKVAGIFFNVYSYAVFNAGTGKSVVQRAPQEG